MTADDLSDERADRDQGRLGDEAEPGSTHAERGAGHPHLVVINGPGLRLGDRRPVSLDQERTTVGSGSHQDVQLEQLAPEHFVIYHDDRDEYRLHAVAEVTGGSAGQAHPRVLHTGATIVAGPWEFTFRRDEHADHGRPYGGRSGGEGSANVTQAPRPADRIRGWAAGDGQVRDDD